MARKIKGRLLLFKSSLQYLVIIIFFLQQLVFWGSQSFSCIHRTEQVYRFFQKWCPNIHNALDDDESEDDEMTDPHYCTAEEEVNRLISLPTDVLWGSFVTHSFMRDKQTPKDVCGEAID